MKKQTILQPIAFIFILLVICLMKCQGQINVKTGGPTKVKIKRGTVATASVQVADYYVSTTGNDNNPGTFSQPFATWKKGFESAGPGDLVYIRGGVYTSTGLVHESTGYAADGYAAESISDVLGTAENRITVMAYPGEHPIYNLTLTQANRIKGVSFKNLAYVTIKGLRVTGSDQTGISISTGAWMETMNYCNIEECEFDHNEGTGLYFWGADSEGDSIINCDFHHNYEPGGGGGNSDGLSINYVTSRTGNQRVITVKGCRAWSNSDDGFDFVLNPGHVYVDNCWSWSNGYVPGTLTPAGNGTGFKMGENDAVNGGVIDGNYMRTVTNCLCFLNRANGFSQNESFLKMEFYNNTSFDNNLTGYFFTWNDVANLFRNNISVSDQNTFIKTGTGNSGLLAVDDHNTWNGGVTANTSDFVSIDSTGVSGARVNGQLPVLNFLKLANGSDLIDAGVDVGYGNDLGAYQKN
jgi:hypothetical protein